MSPYVSDKQRGWMHEFEPDIAASWDREEKARRERTRSKKSKKRKKKSR